MADEPKTPDSAEDDELLLDTPAQGAEPNADASEDDGEAEEVPTFGDESEPQADDTGLVKHLREQIRERDKRLAEVARGTPKQEPIVVGEKPTLAGCDYDEDKYDAERDAWEARRAAAKRQEQTQAQAGEAEKEAWEAELNRYRDSKSKLTYADVDDAEENVKASLDTAQQAVLLMASDDPAKLMYALGKNPDRLAVLAAEKNPLKLAAKIAKLEGQMKMVQRRKPPEPDRPELGSARPSKHTGADKQLAKLEAEADKTGDRTEVIAYRKKLKDTAKA